MNPQFYKGKFKASALVGVVFAFGFSALLFWLHQVNTGSHALSVASPTGYGLSLKVVGNHFVDAQGKTVQLRGVDRMMSCSGHLMNGPADATEAQTMRNWGINIVRISTMDEDCWLNINGVPAQYAGVNYQNAVVNYVNILNKAGIYAIVDLHLNDPGTYTYHAQQVMADEDHSIDYWTSVANTFKSDPAVIFEPYNEPHETTSDTNASDPWVCWRDGCQANVLNHSYTGPKTALNWQGAGMQQLVNTIRNTGAKNPITLGGLSFSNNLNGFLQSDSNGKPYTPNDPLHQLAATFHNYKGWGCGTASCWNGTIAKVAQKMPVITTEFGQHDCGSDFVDPWMQWADTNGINYTAWVWTPGTCPGGVSSGDSGAWGLLADWNGNPNSYGKSILNHLKQVGQGSNPTPSVSLTAPNAGSTVSGSVTVSADAAVSSGSITALVLKQDGAVLKSCGGASCSTAWVTTALSNGTYTLEADTTASDGNTNSTTESVTVSNSHPVSISSPTNVTSPSQTTSSIALTWKASTDSKFPASQLIYQVFRNGSKVGASSAGSTAYTDAGLSSGTYFSYTIVAKDPNGNTSNPSAAFTQNTKSPSCAKPGTPQGFTASAISPTAVNLNWKAVSNPSSTCVISHYVVSRNTVPLSQPTGLSLADTTATPNTKYTYTVLAVETGNIAGPAASANVTTPQSTQPDPGPSAPANVGATAISDTQINLTWSASTDPVTGIKQYNIMRNGTQVGTSTTTSFGDSGLTALTQYTYQVVAVSGGGKTAASSTVNVTTLPSQTKGSGGGGTNPGSSTPALPPVLQGTTSVGSGSDTGQSSSDNPTDPGSSTTSQLSQKSSAPKPQSLGSKKVAYVGGGSVVVLVLAGAGYWLLMVRKRSIFRPSSELYDPDFKSSAVVGDDKHGPHSRIG